jgi:hypothetical protein
LWDCPTPSCCQPFRIDKGEQTLQFLILHGVLYWAEKCSRLGTIANL